MKRSIDRARAFIRDRLPGHRRRRADYRAIFRETEEGRRILHDLARMAGLYAPTFHPDPHRAAMHDGMRNVVLYILHQIGEPDASGGGGGGGGASGEGGAAFLDQHLAARGDYATSPDEAAHNTSSNERT